MNQLKRDVGNISAVTEESSITVLLLLSLENRAEKIVTIIKKKETERTEKRSSQTRRIPSIDYPNQAIGHTECTRTRKPNDHYCN